MSASAGDGRRQVRAGHEDRDRVVSILGEAYTEGRLSKDEYDTRLGAALSARTYADLDELITDLPASTVLAAPVARPVQVAPAARTNGYAIASLACGLGQFVVGPLGTIPAIVLGHMARNQIRRTGEQGAGLALAGLMLGWGAVIFAVLAAVLLISVGVHSGMPAPAPVPGP